MSVKSQEKNMRRLADLLSRDLTYLPGEREDGVNGDKKVFLNTGKIFLRNLGADLCLSQAKVNVNPGGIGVSGECTMIGMWKDSGIYVMLHSPVFDRQSVLLYRTTRHIRDYTGGLNRYLTLENLRNYSYEELLSVLSSIKGAHADERAA